MDLTQMCDCQAFFVNSALNNVLKYSYDISVIPKPHYKFFSLPG